MKRAALYSLIRSSLLAIDEPRLFRTERGYQGALRTELQNRVDGEFLTRADLLVESEYQKALRHHGIRIRPDLIIHIPYDRGENPSRSDGNYAAIELKRRGNVAAARQAFSNINSILTALNYHVGIFVNIDSDKTHFASYRGPHCRRVRCFAARLEREEVVIREEWAA